MKTIFSILILINFAARCQDTITYNGQKFHKTSRPAIYLNADSSTVIVYDAKLDNKILCSEYKYKWLFFTFTKNSTYIYRIRDNIKGGSLYYTNDKGQRINNLLKYHSTDPPFNWIGINN